MGRGEAEMMYAGFVIAILSIIGNIVLIQLVRRERVAKHNLVRELEKAVIYNQT
jgi:hypothetical protein